MDAAYHLAEFLLRVRYEELPEIVVQATKMEIMDLLGVALGGCGEHGAKELTEIVLDWGGKEESSVIGCGSKVPAPNAAHANATMAHALDFDDVHEHLVMHPGIAVIPSCLAMAEKTGNLSGKELIASVAVGVDVMCRLGAATTPGKSPISTGWHLTTLFGYLCSAGVAGRMLKLDRDGLVNALGIAYHQCSGNGQCVKDGALTKRLGPGFAARGGIVAAIMAERGVTGARNCLEGEHGLYRLYMHGDYDPKALTSGLGESFEGQNVSIKPYPCCRGIHPAIDSALAVMAEHKLEAGSIDRIRLFVSEEHYNLLCSPQEAKCKPRNPVDAQFSIPWGVAAAIARNRAVLEDFSPAAIESRDILETAEKIDIQVDNTLRRSSKVDPTRLEITTKQGQSYSEQVEDTLGSLKRPMSFDDCANKFRSCAKRLSGDRIDRCIDLFGRLEQLEDIRDLIRMLCVG